MKKKYYIRNSGKDWTNKDAMDMVLLAAANTPTRVIGLKIGRSEDAVRMKAAQLSISLKPINRSPYNRRFR